MNEHLLKRKKAGIINFIKVPLNWGRCHNEFVGYDLEQKYFFRIFYDNKYREDKFIPVNRINELKEQMDEYSKGGFGSGIFSTKELYEQCKQELDFYNKYLANN